MNIKLLLATFALLICCCSLICGATDEQVSKVDSSARNKLVLPKLFDFANFKNLFKKSYGSFLEELARQKLFMARAFQAFISLIKHKAWQVSSYLRLNDFSDWTPAEIKRIYVPASILRDQFESNVVDPVKQEISPEEPLPAADLNEIKKELSAEIENENSPIAKALEEELHPARRQKRSAELQDRRSRLTLKDIEPESATVIEESPGVSNKHSVRSNNPDYEPPELPSFGDRDGREKRRLPEAEARKINTVASRNDFVKTVLKTASRNPVVAKPDTSLPDQVFIDHRRSNCFRQPRSQGQCGSCYIFSTISFFEWLYCNQTGESIEFSEQYILDCGKELKGCAGGHFFHVSLFIKDYGLELRRNYPYRETKETCPYESHVPKEKMGFMKLDNNGMLKYELEDLETILKRMPILIGVALNEEFSQYGGGVDQNLNCDRDNGHAMLIIGSGREDGEDYWLFRNSHSISWGEQGNYKMAKKALTKERCALTLGYISRAVFKEPAGKGRNPNYDAKPVLRRNMHRSMQAQLA